MAIAFSIKQVLEQWDYQNAYTVFCHYSTNNTLLNILKKETTYNTLRLRRELTELSKKEKPKEITPLERIEVESNVPEPPAVQELLKENLKLFKEASYLHNQLELLSEAERKKAAFEILEKFDLNTKNFDKIAFYKRNGFMPTHDAEKIAPPDTEVMRLKRINNLRTYIAKAKKKGQEDKVLSLTNELNELIK